MSCTDSAKSELRQPGRGKLCFTEKITAQREKSRETQNLESLVEYSFVHMYKEMPKAGKSSKEID